MRRSQPVAVSPKSQVWFSRLDWIGWGGGGGKEQVGLGGEAQSREGIDAGGERADGGWRNLPREKSPPLKRDLFAPESAFGCPIFDSLG